MSLRADLELAIKADAVDDLEDTKDALVDIGKEAKKTDKSVDRFADSAGDAGKEAGDAADDMEDMTDSFGDIEDSAKDGEGALEDFGETTADAADEGGDAIEDMSDTVKDGMGDSEDAVEDFVDTTEDGFDDVSDGTGDVEGAFEDVEDTASDTMEESGEAVEDFANTAETGFDDAASSGDDVGGAFEEVEGITTDTMDASGQAVEGFATTADTGFQGAGDSVNEFATTTETGMDSVIQGTEGVGQAFEDVETTTDTAMTNAGESVVGFADTTGTEMEEVISSTEGVGGAFEDNVATGVETSLAAAGTNITEFSDTSQTEMDEVVASTEGVGESFDSIATDSESALSGAGGNVEEFSETVDTEMEEVQTSADEASTAFDEIETGTESALGGAVTNIEEFAGTVGTEFETVRTATADTDVAFADLSREVIERTHFMGQEVTEFTGVTSEQLGIASTEAEGASGSFVDLSGDITTAMDTAGGAVDGFADDSDVAMGQAAESTGDVDTAFSNTANEVSGAMDDSSIAILSFVGETEEMGGASFDAATEVDTSFSDIETSVTTTIDTAVGSLGSLTGALEDAATGVTPVVEASGDLSESFGAVGVGSSTAGENLNTYSTAMINARMPTDQLEDSSDRFNTTIGLAGVSMGIAASGIIGLVTSYSSLQKMELAAEQTAIRLEAAQNKLIAAQGNLTRLQQSGTASSADLAEAQKKVEMAQNRVNLITKKNAMVQEDLSAAYAQYYTSIIPQVISVTGGLIGIFYDVQRASSGIKAVFTGIKPALQALTAGITGGAVGMGRYATATTTATAAGAPFAVVQGRVAATSIASTGALTGASLAAFKFGVAMRAAAASALTFMKHPIAIAMVAVGTAMAAVGTNAFGFRDALQGAGKAIGDVVPVLQGALKGLEEFGRLMGIVPEEAKAMGTAVDGTQVPLSELDQKNKDLRESNLGLLDSLHGVTDAHLASDVAIQAAVDAYNNDIKVKDEAVRANFNLVESTFGLERATGLTDETLAQVALTIRENAIAGEDTTTVLDAMAEAYFQTGRQLDPLLQQLGLEVDLSRINAQTGWETARSKSALVEAYGQQIDNTIKAEDALRAEVAAVLISKGMHQEAANAVTLGSEALEVLAKHLGITEEEVKAATGPMAEWTKELEGQAQVAKDLAAAVGMELNPAVFDTVDKQAAAGDAAQILKERLVESEQAARAEALALNVMHGELVPAADIFKMSADELEIFNANLNDSDAALAEAKDAVRELTYGFENNRAANEYLVEAFGLTERAAGLTAEELNALAQGTLQVEQESQAAYQSLVKEALSIGYVGDTSRASEQAMRDAIATHKATAEAAGETTEQTDAVTQALNDNAVALNNLNPNIAKTAEGYKLISNGSHAVSEEGKRMMKMFEDLDSQWDSNIETARDLAIVNGVDVVDAYKMTDAQLVDMMLTMDDFNTEQKTIGEIAQEQAQKFADEWQQAFDDYKTAIDDWAADLDSAFQTVGQELGKEMEVIGGEAKQKFSKGVAFNEEFWSKAFPEGVARNAIEGSLDIPGLIADTKAFLDRAVSQGLITEQQSRDWFKPLLDYIGKLPSDVRGGMGLVLAAIPAEMEKLKTTIVGGIAIGPDVKQAVNTGIVQPLIDTLKEGGGFAEAGPALVGHVRKILPQIEAMNPDVAAALQFALVDPMTGIERPIEEQTKMILAILDTISPGIKTMVDEVDTNLNGIPDIIDTNMITPAEEMRLAWVEAQRDIAIITGDWTQEMEDKFQRLKTSITGVEPVLDDMGRGWVETTRDVKGSMIEMEEAADSLIQNGWVNVADASETATRDIIESADGSKRAILDYETNTITYLENVSGEWKKTGTTLGTPHSVAAPNTAEYNAKLVEMSRRTGETIAEIERQFNAMGKRTSKPRHPGAGGGEEAVGGIEVPVPDATKAEAAWRQHFTNVEAMINTFGSTVLARLVQGYGLYNQQIAGPLANVVAQWTNHAAQISAQVNVIGGQHLLRLVQGYGLLGQQINAAFATILTYWTNHAAAVSSQVNVIGGTHLARMVQGYGLMAQQSNIAFGTLIQYWINHAAAVSSQVNVIGGQHLARMVQGYGLMAQQANIAFGQLVSYWINHASAVSNQVNVIGGTHLKRMVQGYVLMAQQVNTALNTQIRAHWNTHASQVSAAINTIGGTHLRRMVQGYELLSRQINTALNTQIRNAWNNHTRTVQSAVSSASNSINNLARAMSNAMSNMVNSMNRGINGARQLQNAINSLRGRTIVVTTQYRTVGRPGAGVTRAQHGWTGIVGPNDPRTFMAGEAGMEFVHIVPLAENATREFIKNDIVQDVSRAQNSTQITTPKLQLATNTTRATGGGFGGGGGGGGGGRPIQVNLNIVSTLKSKVVAEEARSTLLDGISGFV